MAPVVAPDERLPCHLVLQSDNQTKHDCHKSLLFVILIEFYVKENNKQTLDASHSSIESIKYLYNKLS